jgi:hypothetical protein
MAEYVDDNEPIKDKRMYFNEKEFQHYLREYQEAVVYIDGVPKSTNRKAELYITKAVMEIINRIISIYRYHAFEERDDLKQQAFLACYGNFHKFDVSKGSCFNYFSIIAKISLLNYTLRKKKHRGHSDIEEALDLESISHFDHGNFLNDLENKLYRIIDENFLNKRRKRYQQITSVIVEYLRTTVVFVGKTDLYSYARAFGIKNTEIRSFVNDINKKENIFQHFSQYM